MFISRLATLFRAPWEFVQLLSWWSFWKTETQNAQTKCIQIDASLCPHFTKEGRKSNHFWACRHTHTHTHEMKVTIIPKLRLGRTKNLTLFVFQWNNIIHGRLLRKWFLYLSQSNKAQLMNIFSRQVNVLIEIFSWSCCYFLTLFKKKKKSFSNKNADMWKPQFVFFFFPLIYSLYSFFGHFKVLATPSMVPSTSGQHLDQISFVFTGGTSTLGG